MYLLASREAERLGLDNQAKNLKYKSESKFNKVTDLSSFFDEIKYRWKSNPWLGGEPEEGTLMYDLINRSKQPPYIPTPKNIFKQFNGKKR